MKNVKYDDANICKNQYFFVFDDHSWVWALARSLFVFGRLRSSDFVKSHVPLLNYAKKTCAFSQRQNLLKVQKLVLCVFATGIRPLVVFVETKKIQPGASLAPSTGCVGEDFA